MFDLLKTKFCHHDVTCVDKSESTNNVQIEHYEVIK